MKHENDDERILEIVDGEYTFEDVYKKSYIPEEYLRDIKKANVLLLPYENIGKEGSYLFPENTREFYEYLLENSTNDDLSVDICASDEGYQEFERHAEQIYIAQILVFDVALPIVVGLITNYLYDKLKRNNRDDANVEIEITVQKKKKSKTLKYKGNVKGFKKIINSVEDKIFDD